MPGVVLFKPAGVPARTLENIVLTFEELEAVRLKDSEGVDQANAASQMNISRATYQRVLGSARQKIADALVNGKAIQIQGGNYAFDGDQIAKAENNEGNDKVNGTGGVKMKIAVSTSDGVSICGHLGMCSQFIIYEIADNEIASREIRNVTPVHGPGDGHGHGGHHEHAGHSHGGVIGALSDVSAIITNGMGGHFAMALESRGINPVITPVKDPDAAVRAYLDGTLDTSGSRCQCGGH
jgi:predicted DNA-binding protein (UPF0251 family)/predicted Fe-Mo cluster-binding NifX family protein